MRQLAALDEMDAAIRSAEFTKITSVLTSRDGELLHEFYADGITADTRHNTRSATKTVAGLLTGIAIDQGLIASVQAPVLSFFSDRQPVANPDPGKDAITLADLLTMSSALQCNDDDENSPGNEELMYDLDDWVQFALDLPVKPAARPATGVQGPYRQFSYCTAGVGVLGELLVRATGRPVQDFAHQALFAPLGISGEQWKLNPAGIAFTGGGLELTSGDLLKLGQLYLDGGSWHGRQVVSRQWAADSLRQHVRIDDQTGYGYLWWLRTLTPAGGRQVPGYLMQGNGGNKVAVFPSLRLVAVLTSVNFSTPGMHQQTDRLLTEYILPALG